LVNGGTSALAGAITLTLPQAIATTSTPTFASMSLAGALTLKNGESIDNATDSVFAFNRNDAGAVTITGKDTGANTNLIVTPNGSGALTLGSNTTSSVTIATAGTGDSALVLPNNSVGNSELTNSSLTVAAGTGMTVTNGNPVALGGTVTIANNGVLSITGNGTTVAGATTIVGAGINTVDVNGTTKTLTITGTEADTLQTVTARTGGQSSNQALTLSNAAPLTFSSTLSSLTLGAGDVSGAKLTIQDSHAGTANALMTIEDINNGTNSSGKLTVNTATIATINATYISGFTAAGNIAGASYNLTGFGTINGATISGSPTISGGTLAGGSYSGTGATVLGSYDLKIGDSNTFNVWDTTTNTTTPIFTVTDNAGVGDITKVGSINASGTLTLSSLTTAGILINGTNGVVSSQASLPIVQGGTGLTSAPTNGQILIGTAAGGYNLTGLTSGSGINITNPTSGHITIANSGILSVTGAVNGITATTTNGAVSLALPQSLYNGASPTFVGETLSGALSLTGASNQMIIGTGGNTLTISSVQNGVRTATIPTLTNANSSDTFVLANQIQTLTNKALDDGTTTIQNSGDPTKILKFDVGTNLTTGANITLKVPSTGGTIAASANLPITLGSDGAISCGTCLSTANSNYVASLDSITGAITLAQSGGVIDSFTDNAGTHSITINATEKDTLQTVTARTGGQSSNQALTLSNATPLTFSNVTGPTNIILGAGDQNETLNIKDTHTPTANTLLTLADNGTAATLTVNTIAATNIGGFNLTGNVSGVVAPTIDQHGNI
jgi:hypothetical protein